MAEVSQVFYADAVTQVANGDSIFWNTPEYSLGNNVTLYDFAWTDYYTNAVFFTNYLYYKFNETDIKSFIDNNDTLVLTKIVIRVKFAVYQVEETSLFVRLIPLITSNNGIITANPIVSNDTYTIVGDTGVKEASFVYNLSTGIPSVEELIDEGFSPFITAAVNNSNEAQSGVIIYEMSLEVLLETPTSANIDISSSEGDSIENGRVIDLGSIFYPGSLSYKINIDNLGGQDLIIESFSSNYEDNVTFEFTGNELPVQITSSSEPFQVNIKMFNFSLGTHDIDITIRSNSVLNPIFVFQFSLSVLSSGNNSNMSVSYNSEIISNNRTISITAQPKDISKFVQINYSNTGTTPLVISSVFLSGDVFSFPGSTLLNNSVIQAGSSAALNLALNVSSYGNKNATITVNSNDPQNNPFVFNLSYTILPQFEAYLSSEGSVLSDGINVPLGFLDKGKSFIKTYSIKNTGIYKTLIINSVSVSDEMLLNSSISFPFILSPNAANSLVFAIAFDTDSVGLRSGSLTIDYSEGTVQ